MARRKRNIWAAIVARVSSPDRPRGLLPQRALTLVAGRPVLAHIVRRLSHCRELSGLVLAVGRAGEDRPIIEAAEALGLPWLAGHPDDLLRRLNLVARHYGADEVVRINGNFPLIDPWALSRLIVSHWRQSADYSSNSHHQGLVYGLGAEILAGPALERLLARPPQPAGLSSDTRLFLRQALDFRLNLPPAEAGGAQLALAVDFPADVEKIETLLQQDPEPDNAAVIAFHRRQQPFPPGPKGSAEVGLSKVLLFPEKLAALKDNTFSRADLSYPVSVELSLTNQCNQNCRWCSDRQLRHRSPDRLSLRILEDFFEDLARGGTRGVTIEGGGEPSLSPFFEDAALAATGRGLAVGLITNGLELFPPGRDPDFYRRFEWVRVSLDAADPQQYQSLKEVDGFGRVLANLARLSRHAPRSTVGVGYVLSNQNDDPDRLQDLALSLRSLGAAYLQIRPVVDHPELASSRPPLFLKKFETPDFSINLEALSTNQIRGNGGLPCLAHSLSAVIGADGAVWLCGRLNIDEGSRALGNLNQTPFRHIWPGPERARQVALAASADYCQAHCPQCRMSKYNQLLADIDRLKTKNFI